MFLSLRQGMVLLGCLLGIYLFANFLQNHLLLNSDVSWLSLASERLLAGGTYSKNFFEINPPLILYLYIPLVWLKQIFTLEIATRIYVYTLTSLSLLLCWRLLVKIFSPRDNEITISFLLTLGATFFIMPMAEWGQREHLLLMLTMPYFLLTAYHLQTGNDYSPKLSLLIGLLAGLGFALKPYFLISFILLEILYAAKQRSLFACLRTETLTLMGVLIAYIVLILCLHRDYLTVILPIVTSFYYQESSFSYRSLLLSHEAFFTYFSMFFYLIRFKSNPHKILSTVLFIGALGFFMAYCLQRTHWYYHVLPLLAFDILLMTLLFHSMVKQQRLSRTQWLGIAILTGVVFAYLIFRIHYMALSIYYFTFSYFALFFVVFAFLLRRAASLLIIFLIAGIFSGYVNHTYLHAYNFILTTVLLFLLFVVFIPEKSADMKAKFSFFALVGTLIFAYPFYKVAYVYDYSSAYRKLYGNLIQVLRQFPNQSIDFFSNSSEFAFPGVNYGKQKFTSRFGCLCWLSTSLTGRYKDFLISAITEDITRNQPQLIFVDVRKRNSKSQKIYFGSEQMNYIQLFSQNKLFQQAWGNYHYLKTVDGQPLYKFDIYLRNG